MNPGERIVHVSRPPAHASGALDSGDVGRLRLHFKISGVFASPGLIVGIVSPFLALPHPAGT